VKKSNIVLWSALAVFLAVLLAFLLILGFTTKRLLRDHGRAARGEQVRSLLTNAI